MIEPEVAARRPVETDDEAPGCFLRSHGPGWKRPKVKRWTRAMARKELRAVVDKNNNTTENIKL